MQLLENKVILITGGSRGIGAATVQKCVEYGASVAFTYKSSAEQAQKLIDELNLRFPQANIKSYASDARSGQQAAQTIEQVLKDFGKIDALVNNAGITRDNILMRLTEEQWDEVLDTNLKAVFHYCKAICRPMLKAKAGSIINITSVVGISGNAGQANYAASKAGVIGFTKSLGQELGSRNIRCNAIAPGFTETDMTTTLDETVKAKMMENIWLKRFGRADEVANAVAFLASDLSTYISGEVIKVSGGL